MSEEAIAKVTQMMQTLPESTQQPVAEHISKIKIGYL